MAALINNEPSRESERTIKEDVANQGQDMQIYMKPMDSATHIEPSHENEGKESESATNQKQLKHTKSQETTLDNGQEATHVPASTASFAQALHEANTINASSAGSHRIENNDKVKSQDVDPPIPRIHVPTQNHQLSHTFRHHARQSSKQESVQSQKATMSSTYPNITLFLYKPKFPEKSSEKQPEAVTREIHSGPRIDNSTTKKQRIENNSCSAKAQDLDDVNEAYDKTRNHELPRYTSSTDTIHERNEKNNLYIDKPFVDPSIDENSVCQLHDACTIDNAEIIPMKPRDTIYDSKAEESESSVERENEIPIADAVLKTDVTWRMEEQLPEGVTSNPDTRKVRNLDEDKLPVSQTGCEASGNISNEMEVVSEKPRYTEDVSLTTEMYSNKDERDTSHDFERNEDKQNSVFVGGPQSEGEGQDTASVKQTTEVHDASSSKEIENENPKMVKSKGNSKERTAHEKIYDNRMKARPPAGLQNLGNTCFFNAVLQNLNQSFVLYDLLATEKNFNQLLLTRSMVKLSEKMCSGVPYTVPSEVLHNVCRRSPRFAGGRQQDSHELLRHLLDILRNEEREFSENPNNRKTLTKVDEVFGGHFMTVYTCKDCKMPYHVCEPMLDISLPIAYEDFDNYEESDVDREDSETDGDDLTYQRVVESLMTPLAIEDKKDAQDSRSENGSQTGWQQSPTDTKEKKKKNKKKKKRKSTSNFQHPSLKKSRTEGRSILDCLGAFTRTEHIENEYLCMACHAERVKQGATDYQMTSAKKRTLIYNPPALLTLHLKRFEQTAYGFVKCNDKISFQDMIDIGPYCSSRCMRNEGQETSIWYSLYGLVVHGGGLDGGHYVAYVKMRKPDDNIRHFLQESFLDRQQLTEEKLVEMMRDVQNLPITNHEKKSSPQAVNGPWFYVSDSHVSQVHEEEVFIKQAYLLFYERRQSENRSKKSVIYVRPANKLETSV